MAAIGRVLLIPKENYSGTTVYNALDWVRYNGAAWVCKVDNTIGVAPPTLPTIQNANWQLLAADGSVSGSVAWSAVTGKPFDSVKSGGGIDVNVSNELELDTSYLTGSNISYDNTGSGATSTNVQDALDELFNGGGGGGLSNAFDEVEVNGISLIASGGDTLHLLAGSNISLTPNAGTNTVEIASTGGGGTGGHNMTPNPSPSVDEDDVDTAIQAALLEGGENDDVVSAFGVGKWSNLDGFKILSGALTTGTDTIGTWEDDATWPTGSRVGWIWHSALYNILGDNDYDIEPIAELVSGKQTAIGCLAYRFDDNVTVGGVNGGACAMKLCAPIPAEQNNVKVGLMIKHNRTKTFNGTAIT